MAEAARPVRQHTRDARSVERQSASPPLAPGRPFPRRSRGYKPESHLAAHADNRALEVTPPSLRIKLFAAPLADRQSKVLADLIGVPHTAFRATKAPARPTGKR
jgi:hypothetical protein